MNSELGLGIIISIVTGVIAFLSALVFTIVKVMTKSLSDSQSKRITDAIKGIENDFDPLKRDISRNEEDIKEYRRSFDSLKEEWKTFLLDYTKVDTIRGATIDALFKNIDDMRKSLKDLNPAFSKKIEERVKRLESDMKLFVSDLIRNEVRNSKK